MDEDSRYFLSFYLCYRHISFYLNGGNVHGKKYLMYRKMRYIRPRAYIPNRYCLFLRKKSRKVYEPCFILSGSRIHSNFECLELALEIPLLKTI